MKKEFKSLVGEIQAVYNTKNLNKVKIKSSEDAVIEFRKIWSNGSLEYKESMYVLFLNRANNTLGWSLISQGGVSGTVADPKIIFQHALLANASSIILAHNHPSGELNPSQADITLTKKIKEVGIALDLPLLDHIILTIDSYYSMADNCYI